MMTPPSFAKTGAAVLALTGVWFAAAQAQPPQRTTATYEDWTVRCETVTPPGGAAPIKSCELVQSTTAQGQPNPITQVAIGRSSKTEPLRIVFQVPVNVWLPTGVKLVYDEKEPGLAATFKRCAPVGCFADADLKDDMLRKLRARTTPGHFEFKDAIQRDAKIPVSFKGFGQAMDALAKE
jgi:invasion protein IalB